MFLRRTYFSNLAIQLVIYILFLKGSGKIFLVKNTPDRNKTYLSTIYVGKIYEDMNM